MEIGILESILYGIIQGLTEFLPVSSSGHLALIPHFLNKEDPGTYFDLMMHLGTVLALLIYFHKKILRLFFNLKPALTFWHKEEESFSSEDKGDIFFLRNFIVSTLVTIFFVLILKKFALDNGRQMLWITINLVVFGILMMVADKFGKNEQSENARMNERFHPKESILLGMAQSLAIFPGVSRSGITLTASRLMGMGRKEAGHYSFFLSMPIILAGALLKIVESMTGVLIDDGGAILRENFMAMGMGILVSFLVGIMTIHFFLKLIKKIGLFYFGIYRIVFGLFLYLYFF